jgi:hypothetical protein
MHHLGRCTPYFGGYESTIAPYFREKSTQDAWFSDDHKVTFQSLLIGDGDNPQLEDDFWLP